jgi:hypothetical protein
VLWRSSLLSGSAGSPALHDTVRVPDHRAGQKVRIIFQFAQVCRGITFKFVQGRRVFLLVRAVSKMMVRANPHILPYASNNHPSASTNPFFHETVAANGCGTVSRMHPAHSYLIIERIRAIRIAALSLRLSTTHCCPPPPPPPPPRPPLRHCTCIICHLLPSTTYNKVAWATM